MPIHDFDRIINRRDGDSLKWNAYPADVLPMWVADSDFTAPEPLVKVLEKRVQHGVFGYSGCRDDDFQKTVAHWMRSRFNWDARPEWVAFSPSVVVSLAICVRIFTEPGDKVLFLGPSYPPFFSIPRNQGRDPLASSLVLQKGRYEIDFADLEAKMAQPRTRLLLLCSPHNPTGRVFSREELLKIGELCVRHNLLVVSDEIHCDYVFPGQSHLPLPALSGPDVPDELAGRVLVTVNPSKTFNMADLHTSSVICSNPTLLGRFINAVQSMGLRSSALGMLALITAYTQCAWYADQARAYILNNIRLAVSSINENAPGILAAVPESTFLLWLDCRAMGLAQKDLERFFIEKAKLGLNSGTDFGPEGEGFMRLNLACPRSTVIEAMTRLKRAATS